MSELNLNEKLEELYESINKEEKKGKDKINYNKIINLIGSFIENLDKEKKKSKNEKDKEILHDMIDSLKIIKDAYKNKIKDDFLKEREKITEKFYKEKNKYAPPVIYDSQTEEVDNNIQEDDIDEFEILETPIVKEINEICEKIQNILENNEIKEENDNVEALKVRVMQLRDEINKLKPINNDGIKRLKDQINAIRKEADKLNKNINIKLKEK